MPTPSESFYTFAMRVSCPHKSTSVVTGWHPYNRGISFEITDLILQPRRGRAREYFPAIARLSSQEMSKPVVSNWFLHG